MGYVRKISKNKFILIADLGYIAVLEELEM